MFFDDKVSADKIWMPTGTLLEDIKYVYFNVYSVNNMYNKSFKRKIMKNGFLEPQD